MSDLPLKPTVIVPDTSPLVHLAAADALFVLNGFGRVVVIDVVALEATNDLDKPYAADIAAWIEAGQQPGSNRPVEIGVTELGPLYRMAIEQNVKPPRNAGEHHLRRRSGMVAHYRCSSHRQPRIDIDLYQSEQAMTDPVHPAIHRYVSGEISASQAASLLGDKMTVADVFVMTRRADLPLPQPSPAQEQAELAHAIHVLGLRSAQPPK